MWFSNDLLRNLVILAVKINFENIWLQQDRCPAHKMKLENIRLDTAGLYWFPNGFAALVFEFSHISCIIDFRLFSDLRNLSGTTLMNLLSALFMTQLLYVIGVGGVMDSELCIALASALHYVRLCVFSWMLLMTHNMYAQYKIGLHLVPVTDANIGRNFVRYSLLGWGLPSILLLASIFIQYCDKRGILLDTHDLKRQNCWFLDKNAFIYGLVIPSCLTACLTFYYLFRSAILSRYIVGMQPDKRVRDKMRRKRTLQIILFTKNSGTWRVKDSGRDNSQHNGRRKHQSEIRRLSFTFNDFPLY